MISEVVENHVDLMSLAAKSDRFEDGRANVMNNIDYIFQEFLPLVESKIQVGFIPYPHYFIKFKILIYLIIIYL